MPVGVSARHQSIRQFIHHLRVARQTVRVHQIADRNSTATLADTIAVPIIKVADRSIVDTLKPVLPIELVSHAVCDERVPVVVIGV